MKGVIHRLRESKIQFVWCHRLPERSLCIRGTPILCWRCLGIYLAVLGCMLLPLGFLVGLPILVPTPYWFAFAFILMVPLAVDGLGQGLNYWTSTNFRRFGTGILYGLGFSLGMWAFTWYVLQLFKTL